MKFSKHDRVIVTTYRNVRYSARVSVVHRKETNYTVSLLFALDPQNNEIPGTFMGTSTVVGAHQITEFAEGPKQIEERKARDAKERMEDAAATLLVALGLMIEEATWRGWETLNPDTRAFKALAQARAAYDKAMTPPVEG